jgi:hypothetical protein
LKGYFFLLQKANSCNFSSIYIKSQGQSYYVNKKYPQLISLCIAFALMQFFVCSLFLASLLAKQVLYNLSHAANPFLLIFQIGSPVFAQSRPQTTILLPMAPLYHSQLSFSCGVLLTFCLGLALNSQPSPNLSLQSSWDYRHEPLCPTIDAVS